MNLPHITAVMATALLGSLLLAPFAAQADPMKCSGEEKTCISDCGKVARTAVSICVTNCGARKSACLKTGCWDNGTRRYCGLSKR